jgi:hypothetical protein
MSLYTTALAVLASKMRENPQAVVVVSYKGKTVNALRDASTQSSLLSVDGATGETTCVIRLAASGIDFPAKADSMTIDGKTAYIGDAKVDAVGAVLTIPYSLSRPYTGGA